MTGMPNSPRIFSAMPGDVGDRQGKKEHRIDIFLFFQDRNQMSGPFFAYITIDDCADERILFPVARCQFARFFPAVEKVIIAFTLSRTGIRIGPPPQGFNGIAKVRYTRSLHFPFHEELLGAATRMAYTPVYSVNRALNRQPAAS